MSNSNTNPGRSKTTLTLRVSINRTFPGIKLGLQGKDSRWGEFNGAFKAELHTPESLLEEIKHGYAFCAELLTEKCHREHCGQWCRYLD